MANPSDAPLGTGMAEQGKVSIQQRNCMNRKMGLEGLTREEAMKACGVRKERAKGGMVKKGKKVKASVKRAKKPTARIQSSSSNHKFSY